MRNSFVKARLKLGQSVYVVKAAYRDPSVVELMGNLGFDCVWICNEHIAIDRSTLDAMLRAARAGNIDAMVRVRPGSYSDLIQVLEMGANGLMIPQSQSAGEVRSIVKECKFPPLGERKLDGIGADSKFGLLNLNEYLEQANRETFMVIQIENHSAIQEIDEIAAIDGVDVLFLGPGDLSLALGIPGQIDAPPMLKICQEVLDACRRHNKVPGIACGTSEQVEKFFQMGFRFICGTSDFRLVKRGLLLERQLMEKIQSE